MEQPTPAPLVECEVSLSLREYGKFEDWLPLPFFVEGGDLWDARKGTLDGAPAWSNGWIISADRPAKEDAKELDFTAVLAKCENTKPVTPLFFFTDKFDKYRYIVFSDGCIIAERFIGFAVNAFPGLLTFEHGEDPVAPLVGRRDGQRVIVIMPLNSGRITIPEYVPEALQMTVPVPISHCVPAPAE